MHFRYSELSPDSLNRSRVLVVATKSSDSFELFEGSSIVEAGFIELGALDVLSNRELEVLSLVKDGLRVKEIAQLLHRSPKTIETHVASIRRKLGIKDRAEIMQLARRAGLDRTTLAGNRVRIHSSDIGERVSFTLRR